MDHGPQADLSSLEPLTFSAAGFRQRNVFPTPLLVAPVNDAAALNERLRPAILARAARERGAGEDGWRSADDFASWSGPAGAALLEAATRLANGFTALRTPDGAALEGVLNWRSNAWASVSGADHAGQPAYHPGAFWSGVYWVDAGDEAPAGKGAGPGGEFEMHDPRGILPGFSAPQLRMAIPGCLSAGLTDYEAPRTGTMLVFPSWLVHGARRYSGIRPRISVGFTLSA
ncbi:putative 2OG-Fe(II) oxygenase [Pararoseomonas sp. SCSIO 73927]|uniref:putative 2OG-Fe(II) oxygenase n=1 Tax=Pararoseomonas sp. SCSIO 73927 TaxID=3114537 RepID=UPI0030CCE343